MKLKTAAFALLFAVLSVASVYSVLMYQQVVAAAVWIIGLGPACVAMLFVSKDKLQVERWVACIFLLNLYCILMAFIIVNLPQPEPSLFYYIPGSGGISEGFNLFMFLALILYGGLNLFVSLTLFFQFSVAKKASYVTCGLTIAGFIVWFVAGGFILKDNLSLWVFALVAVVNALTLLRLRQIH
jgi:hypothetical protein